MAKTKLTPERRDVIVKALEAGNYDEVAAQAAGVSKASFYNWLKRGEAELERVESAPNARMRQSERPFVDFLDAVTRARAQAEPEMVARIKELGQQDWRALAWFLERRFSGRWANRQRIELELEREIDQMISLLEKNLEPHEFRRVIKILASPAM
jgi:Xaa-Pro aminopeptidase